MSSDDRIIQYCDEVIDSHIDLIKYLVTDEERDPDYQRSGIIAACYMVNSYNMMKSRVEAGLPALP